MQSAATERYPITRHHNAKRKRRCRQINLRYISYVISYSLNDWQFFTQLILDLSSYTANRKWKMNYSIVVDLEFWLSIVNPLSRNCTTIINNTSKRHNYSPKKGHSGGLQAMLVDAFWPSGFGCSSARAEDSFHAQKSTAASQSSASIFLW
jgi:hypothetical protein